MAYTISKSLANDFGGSWFQENLRREFMYDTVVTTPVQSITFMSPDTILITFETTPTDPELEGGIDTVISSHDHVPAVWKMNPADFPNGYVFDSFVRELRNHPTLGPNYNYVSADDGIGWVKCSFLTLPDQAGLDALTQLCIDYDQYLTPTRHTSQAITPQTNLVLAVIPTLIARFQFAGSTRELDFIDVSAYALTGEYSLTVRNATADQTMGTMTGLHNRTWVVNEMYRFDPEPTANYVIEVFACVTSGLGPVFIDEITCWWRPRE